MCEGTHHTRLAACTGLPALHVAPGTPRAILAQTRLVRSSHLPNMCAHTFLPHTHTRRVHTCCQTSRSGCWRRTPPSAATARRTTCTVRALDERRTSPSPCSRCEGGVISVDNDRPCSPDYSYPHSDHTPTHRSPPFLPPLRRNAPRPTAPSPRTCLWRSRWQPSRRYGRGVMKCG